jgi:hypothetical protein
VRSTVITALATLVVAGSLSSGSALGGERSTNRCGDADRSSVEVTAKNMACGNAKRVVEEWEQALIDGVCANAFQTCRVRKFKCNGGQVGDRLEARIHCRRGTKLVRWTENLADH